MSDWQSQKRRELSWWFPSLGIAFGGLSIFLATVGWSPWIVVPLGVLGLAGLTITPFLKEKAQVKDESAAARHQSMLTSGDAMLAPLVKDISLRGWRVHRSLLQSPYLRRDAEDQLITALRSSEPVLVVGSSMAGKTRMAAELVMEEFPNKRVLIPDAPDGVANIMNAGYVPTGHVVWLDDLERYLQDPTNLKARWIQELQDNENVIVATIRATIYETYMPSGDTQARTEWDILQSFTKILLTDEAEENLRLASLSGSTQLSQGILNHGLGTYLGGGFLAVERLESGRSTNPVGRALVLAAIDWQRSGIGEPIPRMLAENLIHPYMTHRAVGVKAEDLEAGFSWALDKAAGGGLFSLLELTEEGKLRPFDYLVDILTSSNGPIPSLVWRAVEQSEASAGQLNHAGLIAGNFGEISSASALFERAAKLGDLDGMVNHAISLDRQDRIEEAMEWDRKAADAGSMRGLTGLAVRMLRSEKENPAAEEMLLRAAEAGESSAMANLGVLYETRGEEVMGTNWYKRAAEAGSALGMVNYAMRLEVQGDERVAEAWYRAALNAGDASGAAHFQLAMLAEKHGNHEDGEAFLREAVNRRNPAAMGKLGLMVASEGRDAEAMSLFQGAAERGGAVGLSMVGREFARQGKYDEAEGMFKRAIARRLSWAITDLGVLYANCGRIDEAKEQYLLAIAAGEDHALQNYGELLMLENKLPEGELVFRKAAGLGSSTGMYLLSQLLIAGGKEEDIAEASSLLDKAAVLGSLGALYESGKRAAAAGNTEKALQHMRSAASGGHAGATEYLTNLNSDKA